jgi:hypothetical protein
MNSGEAELRPIDEDGPEDALVLRPQLDVLMHRLPPGGASFLQALASSRSLGEAAESAAAHCGEFDVAANLLGALSAGVLTQMLPPSDRSQAP